MEQQTKETVPLWLAVAITVVVSLPFGLWLGNWNLPIWASFIVWAEYFALGAKAEALLTIVPAYLAGVIVTAVILVANVYVTEWLGTTKIYTNGDLATAITFFVGFCVAVYIMRYWSVLQTGSLPYFNGISMILAVFFTGFETAAFPGVDAHLLPVGAAVMAGLAGLLGAALGWFNVTITFPHPVGREEREERGAIGA